MSQTKIINKSEDSNGYTTLRERAQTITFAKIQEILQRNVTRSPNKTFTRYTKDLIKTYIQSPASNQDTLRDISRFLCRYSMLYQKIIMYYASMPLFYHNITQINDLSKKISEKKALKDYGNILEKFSHFNIKKDGYTALYMAIRDGFYVGYMYDNGDDGMFLMPLDVQYCRIYGKNSAGEWIVYFDAGYFSQGNNSEFVEGIDGETTGLWDDVFVEGWKAYQADRRGAQWFRLPPEKTCVLLTCSDDEFMYPLPFWIPIFTSILDLLDLEQIIQSKNELENYKMIINKIPLSENGDTNTIDDFAISLELTQFFTDLMNQVLPDLVGNTYSPFDVEVINFENSNNSKDTNTLGKGIQNLFNNAGASEVVVAGGGSNPSTLAIKYSQIEDMDIVWIWVNRFESWINYYIKENIAKGYLFEIFRVTDFNKEEFVQEKKDMATLGGSALDLMAAVDGSPYKAINKLRFENAIGLKDLMVPLQTSYTQSNEVGRPTVDDDELSGSRDRTRNTE